MDSSNLKGKTPLIRPCIIQTPPFNSSSPRIPLKVEAGSTPGPGAYGIPKLDQEKTGKYHIQPKKKSSLKQQFEWIFNSTRSKNICLPNSNPRLGPGSYNLSQEAKVRVPWDKCQRFLPKNIQCSAVGPGSYDISKAHFTEKEKQGIQSIFKSNTPKNSLFKQAQRINQRETQLFFPALEEQEVEKMNPKKKHTGKCGNFFSKVPRFLSEGNEQKVGPGSYNITNSGGLKNPQHPRIIRISQSGNTCTSSPKKRNSVGLSTDLGPGSYNVRKFDISHDLDYKGQSFPKETRFNFSHSKRQRVSSQVPGPGKYQPQKRTPSRKSETLARKIIKSRKFQGLKSLHQRGTLYSGEDQQERPEGPGEYVLDQYDISHRQQKRKEHLQKLKMMEISLAAFSSKVPRF